MTGTEYEEDKLSWRDKIVLILGYPALLWMLAAIPAMQGEYEFSWRDFVYLVIISPLALVSGIVLLLILLVVFAVRGIRRMVKW